MFQNRQRQVEEQLHEYRTVVDATMQGLLNLFRDIGEGERIERLAELVDVIARSESRADEIRREVEVLMYSKALFPESRGDILQMLEAMDRIPNQAEKIGKELLAYDLGIPKKLRQDFFRLTSGAVDCVGALLEASEKLFSDFTNAGVAVGRVDELESAVDELEADLIARIFRSDRADLDKILLRDVARNIAGICDRAEDAGDRIRIMVATRVL